MLENRSNTLTCELSGKITLRNERISLQVVRLSAQKNEFGRMNFRHNRHITFFLFI